MKNPKETLDKAITTVKSKSRKSGQAITKSLLTLRDKAVANMEVFRRAQKNK